MFNLFKKMSQDLRFILIALGQKSMKPQDLQRLDDSQRSLIHWAAYFDNLELFRKCLATQSLKTADRWGRYAVQYACMGQSLQVLKFLTEQIGVDLKKEFDSYGAPIWWEGFQYSGRSYSERGKRQSVKIFSEDDYYDYIKFLQKHGVDFNQRHTKFFGETLAYELLRSYKHQALFCLVKSDLVDVNAIAREDHQWTLVEACGFMEDHRAKAFAARDKFFEKTYLEIFKRADLALKNEQGEDVVTFLCRRGWKNNLLLLKQVKIVNLTLEQKLWLNRYEIMEKFRKDSDSVQAYEHLLFAKMKPVDTDLFSLERELLIKGLDDKEIAQPGVKSLAELRQHRQIEVGCTKVYRV